MLEQLDIHTEKITFNIYHTPFKTINLKRVIDLNVTSKIIKLLEEYIRGNICSIGLDKIFLEKNMKRNEKN